MTEIKVPTLGESVTEATVATWFKSPGDTVAIDEMLCELETDKVTVEVPSTVSGTLSEIIAKEGDTVGLDAILGIVSEGEFVKTKTEKSVKKNAPKNDKKIQDIENAPSAKKLMKENEINEKTLLGTGRDGRIMKEDVLNVLTSEMTKDESANKTSETVQNVKENYNEQIERIKMSRLRMTIAKRLKEAQNTAAMLTTYNEIDMSSVMEIRSKYKEVFEKKHLVKLGFMSFFVKACCHALREVPEVNAQIDGDDLVFHKYINMGVAVGTPTGLVVPIVKNADSMGFADVEKTIGDLLSNFWGISVFQCS